MTITDLGNIMGPPGPQGPQGLPGVNAVPADAAVAGYVATPATATELALSDRYERAFRPNTVVFLGDSITQSNINIGADQFGENHANSVAMIMQQRLRPLAFKGVSGDKCADMLARLSADVLAFNPGWCYILAGTNDVLNNTMVAGKAALITILTTLRKNGIAPILCTIPPNTTQPTRARQWNLMLRTLAASLSIPLVDYYAQTVDRTTGAWKSGYSGDGTHPEKVAVAAMALAAPLALDRILPSATAPLTWDEVDTINLLSKGMFLSGVNGSGIPTGWASGNASGSGGTTSIVDGLGSLAGLKLFELNKSGSTQWNISQTIAAGFSVGDEIEFMGVFEIESPASTPQLNFFMYFRDAGAVNISSVSPVRQYEAANGAMFFRVRRTVPAGCASIRIDFSTSTAGSAKLRMGRMSLVNLTANAI